MKWDVPRITPEEICLVNTRTRKTGCVGEITPGSTSEKRALSQHKRGNKHLWIIQREVYNENANLSLASERSEMFHRMCQRLHQKCIEFEKQEFAFPWRRITEVEPTGLSKFVYQRGPVRGWHPEWILYEMRERTWNVSLLGCAKKGERREHREEDRYREESRWERREGRG